MATQKRPRPNSELWALAAAQQWVITRAQLLELGLTPAEVRSRVASGRLHRMWRGVYAVGRPVMGPLGRWMAAVLACGPGAVLSHGSAMALLGIGEERGEIEVSVPHATTRCGRTGILVHRRTVLTASDVTKRHGIPVTTPACTLVDQATRLSVRQIEAAVNAADKLGLITPPALRAALEEIGPRPGAPALRAILDWRTFRLTDSELERRFLAIVRRAGLPMPATQRMLNGYRVDFYWPDLGLVVETDGLTYHRTPAQQARDRRRDQAHTAAGLTVLRFTHGQIRYAADYVLETLVEVVSRLAA